MIIYTNGEILQSFPIPTGPEWREATDEDIAAIEGLVNASLQAGAERAWRDTELARADIELNKAQDGDGVGTVKAWRDYRKALRAWPDTVGFPSAESRPVAPDLN